MEIKTEVSPRIVKKGDVFKIVLTINNNTNDLVRVVSIKIDLPPAFLKVKRVKSSDVERREAFRNWWWDHLPPSLEEDDVEPIVVNTEIQSNAKLEQAIQIKAGWSGSPFRPRPETYIIPLTVKYADSTGRPNTEITSLELSLFPSFGTMLLGTLVGSLLGTVAKNSEKISVFTVESIMSIFVIPVIFGLIAGLILTRKKDVQPFLTIEDFWGGIVVGFVVGYQGSQILENALNIPFGETPSTGRPFSSWLSRT